MEHHLFTNQTPVTFVIFGATGDLAEKKLFPSLFHLFHKRLLLSDQFRIVGFARRELSHDKFRSMVAGFLSGQGIRRSPEVETFLSKILYHQGYFDEISAYEGLLPVLQEIDEQLGACSHKLFHLSLSPFYYESVLSLIDQSGLNISCVDGPGKTKILLEKPLGIDSKSGKIINTLLSKIFIEDHVFRVDHYLMKPAITDLLTMHLYEPQLLDVWNSKFIDHIELHLFEKGDIAGRGSFYDHIGALRDVGQNHLLQMLALLAMEKPTGNDLRKELRKERKSVLSKLAVTKFSKKLPHLIRAQYEGYDTEEGVEVGSQTETYFSVEAVVHSRRWTGVPFILSSGKSLNESKVEAVVHFKNGDKIEFVVQPDPHVTFRIGGKVEVLGWKDVRESFGQPGHLPTVSSAGNESPIFVEGYEKVYYDALHCNQAGFVEKGEIEAAWHFIDHVRSLWKRVPLVSYPKGSEPLHFTGKIQ